MADFELESTSAAAAEHEAKTAEALFDSIGDGAIATDEFGRITRVNAVAAKILGYKRQELIGAWFPKKITMVDADDSAVNLIDRPITKAFLAGRPISQKTYYRRKNGQVVPVAMTVSPILVGDKPVGAIEVFRDISFEEEVDRIKSEFISLASHQLRTPLSAIKTYSHMLIEGYMGEVSVSQQKALQTIVGASNRMNELISMLLNITRMESGAVATTMHLMQVDELVNEVKKDLEHLATSKKVHVTSRMGSGYSKTIRSDRMILKEVLANLVSNGIKYTPEGGSVTISVLPHADEIVLRVSDTGWGIPKYSQDQIFSKFFRAENVVKRETTGTGLGLYLVKGLVDALGGKIWFKSAEGKGTDFFLSLPRGRRAPKLRAKTKP